MTTDMKPERRRYVRVAYERKVALVQGLCRRIEAGENITEICRDPTMPQRSALIAWLARDLELRGMVQAAQDAAAQVFGRRREYHRYDPEVAEEVLARIEDGRGLREVCAEPDMPVHSTVTRWLRERPEYADAYRLTREAQADRLFDLAWRIALEATEETERTARLKIQTLKWRCGKLAPRRYGTIKAQAPEDDDEPADDGREKVTRFEVRQFAVTPDRKVVEMTGAVRGMTEPEKRELTQAIREGRITAEDLQRLNVAGGPAASLG